MSIVRVGLAETKKFSEGYEAIFGGRQGSSKAPKAKAKKAPAKKKKAKKK